MLLHTILASTPRLDELVAAVVLDVRSPLPVKGKTVLYQYAWSTELEVEVKREIFRRANEIKAAVKGATVETPKTRPVPVLLASGELTTGPDEIAILLPIKPREALEQAELQTWEKGNSRSKTKLMPGLILIFPNVRYVMPDTIPFVPLFCRISPSDSAELAKGSEG